MRPVSVGGRLGPDDGESRIAGNLAHSVMSSLNSGARADTVNRTHRVVRERARTLQANRSRMRGLLLPLVLCSSLLILTNAALWKLVEQYETVSPEAPAECHHLFFLLLWFLPVSIALGVLVWVRHSRNRSGTETNR